MSGDQHAGHVMHTRQSDGRTILRSTFGMTKRLIGSHARAVCNDKTLRRCTKTALRTGPAWAARLTCGSSQRLKASDAAQVAGGGFAVRAHVGSSQTVRARMRWNDPKQTYIEFTTDVRSRHRDLVRAPRGIPSGLRVQT